MENNNKAKWINTVLSEIEKLPLNESTKILETCGRECLKSTSDRLERIDELRKSVNNENDIDLLFKLYKERIYNNSERLYMKDGVIHLIYDECACGMVKDGGITNPQLCYCTRGYSKAIFERLFNRTVDVKLKRTILRGDDKCEQEILVKRY